ncbi:VQ motif-containing protein 10 [Carex littledalei]|uniref:VQ motif-containing protein 10 n=1 Tax=Carex littledalei TaxID=544730 RepID=A0A833QVM6_9POAL|nr:VQ motif-containing protein 10 [Carex littledalei]
MAGGSREQDKQVKVTIIETRFVKTDEANFKSVVYQFTGKNSTVSMAPHTSPMRPQARRAVPIMAPLQMEVPNASRLSEASRAQNGMVNIDFQYQAAFMEDFEPFLEDLYKLIDP